MSFDCLGAIHVKGGGGFFDSSNGSRVGAFIVGGRTFIAGDFHRRQVTLLGNRTKRLEQRKPFQLGERREKNGAPNVFVHPRIGPSY